MALQASSFRMEHMTLASEELSSEKLPPNNLASVYHHLLDNYPIVLLEEPFADSWTAFKATSKIEIVSDDLVATNMGRIKTANKKKLATHYSIDQIGTITDAIMAQLNFGNCTGLVLNDVKRKNGVQPWMERFCISLIWRYD
jgi:enolase